MNQLGGGLGRGTGLFGTPQTGGLGGGLSGTNTGGGLFGPKPGGLFSGSTQSGGGLFGQTSTTQTGGLFGGGNTGGGGLFQTPQGGGLNQQKTFGGGGLFGQTPSLGTSTSGLGGGLGGGLLGGGGGGGGLFSQSQNTPASGGLFRPQNTATSLGGTTGGGLFGNKGLGLGTGLGTNLGGGLGGGGLGVGMTVKFEPVSGTDTVNKNGITQTVNTKLYCISAMKQFEQNSLEEIRLSDYQAGRKGPTGGGMGTGLSLGGGLMGTQPGGLGGIGGTSVIGQSKPIGGGLFSQSTQQQQLGGLGASTSTAGGLFSGQQGGGLFGNTQNPLGGLGNAGGLFNQQAAQTGGLFNQQTSTAGGGLFNQQSQTSGIGGLGTTGGLGGGGLFNRGGTTGLGTSLQSSQAGSLFNKPLGTSSALGGGLSLGQPGQTGLGGLSLGGLGGSTGLGGGLGGMGIGIVGMGTQTTLGGGGLGRGLGLGTGLGGGLGTLGATQNTNLGQSSLQSVSLQQQQAHLNQQLENLANSPFGDSPLFRSALSDAAKRKPSDKSISNPSKVTPTHPSHYKLNTRPSPRLKPKTLNSPMKHHEKYKLFEGLDFSNTSSVGVAGGGETFVPRSDIKKLKIKPKPSQPHSISDVATPPPPTDWQQQPRETTPTTSHVAAFHPPPVSTVQQHDVTMGTPDASLLATPLQKPVPVRPQTTPTSASASSPSVPVTSTGDTPTPKRLSPPKTYHGSGSLTRSPIRPRRCRLTLPVEYYTIPSLDELDSMSTDSSCLVQNFTIGRKGYGEIHFPGPTDVYGMNLAVIVTINSKEVVVYSDDANKPPEGDGLNKKAVVSLEGNWPVDKSTREPIMEPERIEKMGYVHKLQRMTEKIGATFLDYDPNTGVCRFEVNHFSKYKLDAEDESEDENGQDAGGVKKIKTQGVNKQTTTTAMTVGGAAQRTTRTRPVLQSRQPSALRVEQRTDQDENMSDEDGFEDALGVVKSSRAHPLPVSQQLAATMGVHTHRVQVMKASFFGQEEQLQRVHTPPLQRQGLLRGTYQQTTPLTQATPLSHPTSDVRYTPPSSIQAQSAVLLAKHDLRTLVPYKDSLVKGCEQHIADFGLFMGRSFRVGWGPNWTLSHSGAQMSRSQTKSSSLFSGFGRAMSEKRGEGLPVRALVEKVTVSGSKEESSAYYAKFLEVLLAHTQFSDMPIQATPTPGTKLLHALTDLVQTTPVESLAARQLKRVLELAVALWGDLPSDCNSDPDSYDWSVARKRNVYKWLKSTNSEVTKRSADPENYVRTLFSLVAGQQLSEACQLAHEKGDVRLALLLGQATQNTVINRAYLCKQLEEWRRQGTDQWIDRERLKLYVLLSGQVVWDLFREERRERGVVNICEGLDWKRVFALHLCYVCTPSSDISTVLASYLASFQSEAPCTSPPRPPYLEDSDAPLDDPLSLDTCFHLLQLYCQRDHCLEMTLDPSSSLPHCLDYGISWLLWSVLTALGYTHMHPTRQAQLHVSFSAQLEHEGVWQWAVLPLQHISDATLFENAVRELLTRNCSSSEELSEQEQFVVEQLQVAKEWVYAAKALRARYEKNYVLEARHLLEAGQWNDAHTVIIKHLAADAIISGESGDLLQMLQLLSDPDKCVSVANWDIGGSVYLDFLRIGDQLLSMGQKAPQGSGQLLEDLILGLSALADRVVNLECPTPKETLCQAEVAKKTATFMKLVLSLKYPEDSGELYKELSQTLSQLPLPSDYALVEYRHLIQPCLSQLANCY